MLVVLDNARDTAQVMPLLPGSSRCGLLVTSRHQLTGLITTHGAQELHLDVLSEWDARDLLAYHLGQAQVTGEPEAMTEVLSWCAGLPLALGIVAARAATHPEFPLSVLAAELREASARLDALNAGELSTNLRAVFSCSYRALDAEAAMTFGLLSVTPGPAISLPAAASLTAQSTTSARVLLRKLEAASLVEQHLPDRYRMHDLTRLYAAERAHHDHSSDAQDTALKRLIGFYLHTAFIGERLLHPQRASIELSAPASDCPPEELDSKATALRWFDTNHPCLLAAQKSAEARGWYEPVWQFAWALDSFHRRRGHLHAHLATWQAGLIAAQRLGEPAANAIAHRHLGQAYVRVGELADALDHLHRALMLAEQTKDVPGQAHTHNALALAWELRGNEQEALTHATHALRLFRTLDNPVWEADALNGAGWYHARLGDHQQGLASCEAALTLCRHHSHREGEANTLDHLGHLAHHSGQLILAIDHYLLALTLFRGLGDAYQEADTLASLGEVYAGLGRHTDAFDNWQRALTLYVAQHRSAGVENVQQRLAFLGVARRSPRLSTFPNGEDGAGAHRWIQQAWASSVRVQPGLVPAWVPPYEGVRRVRAP
jgi:tetratricopeptide (TPR) repeat protein